MAVDPNADPVPGADPAPETPAPPAVQVEEIAFLNGNRNTPVLNLGDDPSTPGNSLVVRLGIAESVPSIQVSKEEGTPPGSVPPPPANLI